VAVRELNIASRQSTLLISSPSANFADPSQVGADVIFDMHSTTGFPIWIGTIINGVLKQFPKPAIADVDPKLSPDLTTIAAMREISAHEFHTIVEPIGGGAVIDLTPSGDINAVPEWAADSNTLIYWGPSNPNIGLFTMTKDGANRVAVPLPTSSNYSMAAFWPGSNDAIIYSARTVNQ
jgi:hypothetical protein